MAIAEPTRAPAAAQTPGKNITDLAVEISARRARGERTPWDIVCEMEDPVEAISDYVGMLAIISCDNDLQKEIASAISRLVQDMRPCVREIEELRGRLFHALHPRRGEPGFPDDGNGEVEDSEGDMA